MWRYPHLGIIVHRILCLCQAEKEVFINGAENSSFANTFYLVTANDEVYEMNFI